MRTSPPWLGCISAVPTTRPALVTATRVRPGSSCTQMARASSDVVARSQQYVSPAAMIGCMKAQIAAQSSAAAGRIVSAFESDVSGTAVTGRSALQGRT